MSTKKVLRENLGQVRRPKITQTVIEGILDSTSQHLSGDCEESCGEGTWKTIDAIDAADSWARAMRDWMIRRETWKSPAKAER